ncbi:ABC transporter permease [Aneurinibacillus aneurinilyticus]|jgi:hypothetical protein|uniref:ABC-2 type transporter n=1 Tax=Aneurinibacillus aneurinilyticus ATCC 12856 TaxID=649747 RepID=U1YHY5_ANEAE|nr:ABC transporter permease [Aneurinibacillus aneurinilyticus]ERI10386.1 hypothetical protein HMPREF0083_01510 [Aneurinibacillus aneurinilyticus ATCC 12856]MCI1696161.1 ABC transporter permease [Aneurinibacillus aneurinilyticus]MED0705081.1 ABC transporter permease [Aneurinibacillus aneurinilyticus]MED0724276.1 ABC transporter permease [Aneurinibacillus aneurinilyticus]MED0733084.1 ABC transporter permease [Aneurinibacillus aneurinilyticus]
MGYAALEFYKIRHKKIFLMIVFLLCIELFWAFMSGSISLSRDPDAVSWEVIITIIAQMNGLFLPILTAVIVSRICDMEHKGNTWKMLMAASVKREQIYAAKYICACSLILFVIVLQLVAIVVFCQSKSLTSPIPWELLVQTAMGTLVTSMAVIALQQWISLAVPNQAFALCLGMLGGFIGITASLFPGMVRHFFIWSYYNELSPIVMKYINSSVVYVTQGLSFPFVGGLLLFSVLLYAVGNFYICRKEV